MNAPLSVEQRRAFGLLANDINRKNPVSVVCLDDDGHPVTVMDQWHQSFEMAKLPPPPSAATEYGRNCAAEVLARARAISTSVPKTFGIGAAERRKLEANMSWRDTPRGHRMILARMAGLTPEIVDELDRNLSESEKAHLRAAAAELRDSFAALTRAL